MCIIGLDREEDVNKYYSIYINWSVGGELGDCFSSFTDGMFGQFSGKEEFHGSLYFSEREGSLFVVSDKLWGFDSDSIEDVIDERVHDAHGFFGDTGFGVDLFQDLVDVDGEGFYSSFVSFFGRGFYFGWYFAYGLFLGWHFVYFI